MEKNGFSAPVAQLDRVPGYELGGREFESLRAHHFYSARRGACTPFCFQRETCMAFRENDDQETQGVLRYGLTERGGTRNISRLRW